MTSNSNKKKITATGDFDRARLFQKHFNTFRRVISFFPDIDEEARSFLLALLDQTDNLTKDVVVNLRKHPKLGEKVYDAVRRLNYGEYGGKIEDYLYKQKIGGGIYTNYFIGNPKSKILAEKRVLEPAKQYDINNPHHKRKFPIVWFAGKRWNNPNTTAEDSPYIHSHLSFTKSRVQGGPRILNH